MLAITDNRVPAPCIEKLRECGFTPTSLPAFERLSPAVASHTDMLLFFGFGKLFCHREYYEKNKTLIDGIIMVSGHSLVLSDEEISHDYPKDVLFNCVLLGRFLLCNKSTVSRLILKEAQAQGYTVLHTNQGYTKCSTCKVDDNAIITSDKSIYKVCTSHGIDVLEVPCGGVSLLGYEYGFIGGASGTCESTVFFCGDVGTHPSGEDIKNFCKKHQKEVFCLSFDPLFDCGSIFFV